MPLMTFEIEQNLRISIPGLCYHGFGRNGDQMATEFGVSSSKALPFWDPGFFPLAIGKEKIFIPILWMKSKSQGARSHPVKKYKEGPGTPDPWPSTSLGPLPYLLLMNTALGPPELGFRAQEKAQSLGSWAACKTYQQESRQMRGNE